MQRSTIAARALTVIMPVGVALAAAAAAHAQPSGTALAERIAAAGDGTVHLRYAARPEVCGHRRGGISIRRDERRVHARDGWADGCEHGPAHVTLLVESGRVAAIRTRVGAGPGAAGPRRRAGRRDPERSGAAHDLGPVPSSAAADYFLTLASELEREDTAEDAILAAVIADSTTVWPRLLVIAKDSARPRDVRKAAVFWVGQAAAGAATEGLENVAWSDAERDVREHAVFALSQRPAAEGVPVLIRIARTSRDAGLREKALFWLAESEDPRALALFEELLTRR